MINSKNKIHQGGGGGGWFFLVWGGVFFFGVVFLGRWEVFL